MRRIHQLILIAALTVFYAAPPAHAAWDDDDGMTFEPDDVKKPAPKQANKPAEQEGEPEIEIEGEGEAQPEEPEIEIEGEGEPAPDLASDLASTEPAKADEVIQLQETRVSWQDVVVVMRKPFLKVRRFDFMPTFGITMNDNIIQHVSAGGQASYYLTDVLSVGLEGFLYADNRREPFDLVARQARRLPTVNKYNWSAALNFNYVPVYGKFAVLDSYIIHWESYFTAGVGVTRSEVIPRNPALQPFENTLITPNVGVSMRFFITKFLTVNLGIRDYIFVDKFENVSRTEVSGDLAKENASSALINNVMFQAGLAIWFPMSFEYTTFR